MHIVEKTFQEIEYKKLVLEKYDTIPEDADKRLHEVLQEYKYRINARDFFLRLSLLKNELPEKKEHSYYAKKFGIRGVKKIQISNGEVVYRIPVVCWDISSFQFHSTNCYLIIGKKITLIDCASPYSEQSFIEGFNVVRKFYGESIRIEDIDNLILTHAHVDHLQF